MVEHAEIFWSLFADDMDKVLAEQPRDTWDSFPLFKILNDYLREDGTCAFVFIPFVINLQQKCFTSIISII